ncbi:hypothetical protein AMAG_14252 [Allomyces macrogynus ATCC 38327]|uniref:Integral membrane protein n=1 Tax=Allomyces macrogynus (strain ATCC 38327) TaxID=578462 RepID=A0A0L0T4N7_ALLM3|nr:hypothetical protein AMAG_14252 [Allomyces macrogynus ATCC 38327]|eukprot:KNE69705.1 hypothetical protein AMAG_14252 [Allomyces macrogynus ATCC 38327]
MWRAVRLFIRRRSWFYAAMFVLTLTEIYDLTFILFYLFNGATTSQMVLDYLACAIFTVLFAVLNLVRFRQVAGPAWPRTTNVLVVCTGVFAAYWFVHTCFGWYHIASTGHYGDIVITTQMSAVGYLLDVLLNAALSMAFLLHLRSMSRGNVFRTGMQRYVTKAQIMLVLESLSIAVALTLQLIDPTLDPLWLLMFLAQGVRMAAYCKLLHLLTRIMAQRKTASRTAQSTSFSTTESGGIGGGTGHLPTNAAIAAMVQVRPGSDRTLGPGLPRRASKTFGGAGNGKTTGLPSTTESAAGPSLMRSTEMLGE